MITHPKLLPYYLSGGYVHVRRKTFILAALRARQLPSWLAMIQLIPMNALIELPKFHHPLLSFMTLYI